MHKAILPIVSVVAIVLVIAGIYYIVNRKQESYSPSTVQFMKKVQAMPSVTFYLSNDGINELSSPMNLVKTVNSISNLQLAMGQMIAPSFKIGVPPSISQEYNGALVITHSSLAQPLVFPFGKTLEFIANDMENLYRRIPENQVPLELDLKQIENSAF